MYESSSDSVPQLKRFLAVLANHREKLERQREDIDVTLAEITLHEQECRRVLEGGAPQKSSRKTAAKPPMKPRVRQAA